MIGVVLPGGVTATLVVPDTMLFKVLPDPLVNARLEVAPVPKTSPEPLPEEPDTVPVNRPEPEAPDCGKNPKMVPLITLPVNVKPLEVTTIVPVEVATEEGQLGVNKPLVLVDVAFKT